MTEAEEKKFYEAYKIAIQARNFHFEQFNKWMNFFYVAIGAIFYAYCTNKEGELRPILSVFGLTVSFLGFLSCKGYYYWIYNWLAQIIRFESDLKEDYRVYSTFSLEVFGWDNAQDQYPDYIRDEDNDYLNALPYEEKKKLKEGKLNNMLHPLKSANASTSTLSLMFFLIICVVWSHLVIVNFVFTKWHLYTKCRPLVWGISYILPFFLLSILIIISNIFKKQIGSKPIDGHYFFINRKNDKLNS